MGRIRPNEPIDRTEFQATCRQALEEARRNGSELNLSSLTQIAREVQMMMGHWIVWIPEDSKDVDRTWRLICRGLHEGMFGRYNVARLAIHYNYEDWRYDSRKYRLVISNRDYTNLKEVMDIEAAFRSLGIRDVLYYKAAVFSYMGLYVENSYNIPPSLYQSTWCETEGHSFIQCKHPAINYEWHPPTFRAQYKLRKPAHMLK